MENELIFQLNDLGNFLIIQPIELEYEKSNLDWDCNWINCHIKVKSGSFNGSYKAELTTFDFENFKHDLNCIYNNLNGKIEFKDLEGYLTINIVGDGTGNFASQIICNDRPGIYSTELTFELGFDQTFIKEMVYNLNEITKSFPIVGDYNKNNYNI